MRCLRAHECVPRWRRRARSAHEYATAALFIVDALMHAIEPPPPPPGRDIAAGARVSAPRRRALRLGVDVVSSVPWELLFTLTGTPRLLWAGRLVKSLRLGQLWGHPGLRGMARAARAALHMGHRALRVCGFVAATFWIAHLGACGWYAVGTMGLPRDGWLVHVGGVTDLAAGGAGVYVAALYYAVGTVAVIGTRCRCARAGAPCRGWRSTALATRDSPHPHPSAVQEARTWAQSRLRSAASRSRSCSWASRGSPRSSAPCPRPSLGP